MITVKIMSELTGVSIRTLHYYDEIGILTPSVTTDSGYRLYNDESLKRMQEIMLFRELEFPLKDIKRILESPDYDRKLALKQQVELLTLKKERIQSLIELANRILHNGGNTMSFKEFDSTKIDQYAKEAKEKWGHTDAYKESTQKTSCYSESKQNQLETEMMDIFRELGKLKELDSADENAQKLVGKLQQFITDHYYSCSKEILFGLGQMYVSDPRFRENIDNAGGSGTAEFTQHAISAYCSK